MRKISRRNFLLTAGVVSAAALLAACGSLTLNGNPVVSHSSGGKSQHQDNSHNNSAGRGFFMPGKTGTQRIDRIHGDAA